MLVTRRRIAALVAAGLLAAPAPALGQSAGDDQYEDPFSGENQDQPAAAEETGGGTEPAATPEAAATADGGGEEAAPAEQRELPYTGADAGAILLAGSVLLAGGVALRIGARERS